MVYVNLAGKKKFMVTDQDFINQNRHKLVKFKTENGLPVGEYLIITSGYYVYNRNLKSRRIKSPFHSIIDAYKFCTKLEEIYGELLHILIDKSYAGVFFQLTRYTVSDGIYLRDKIRSLDNLREIKRSDFSFIL